MSYYYSLYRSPSYSQDFPGQWVGMCLLDIRGIFTTFIVVLIKSCVVPPTRIVWLVIFCPMDVRPVCCDYLLCVCFCFVKTFNPIFLSELDNY